MDILNQEEDYEAFVTLLESRFDRPLTDEEEQKVRFVAQMGDQHMLNNLFGQLGSVRQDN